MEKSLNQIYKKQNSNLTFADWVKEYKKNTEFIPDKRQDLVVKKSNPVIYSVYHYKKGYRCFYCDDLLNLSHKNKSNSKTIDHIIPLSKGGSDRVENKVSSCKSCNQKKSNYSLEEFIEIIKTEKKVLLAKSNKIISQSKKIIKNPKFHLK